MTLILGELAKGYQYVFFDLADPRFKDYPLLGSPVWIAGVIGLYLYVVKWLGPRLMRDRKPFKLDRVIQVYDAIQIVLSLAIFERSLSLAWLNGYSLQCTPVDYSLNPDSVTLGTWTYLFFLMKLMDLADTVFIVMRKKDGQLSFLHIYHHSMIAVVLWGVAKYIAGGHHVMMATLNSLVHAVMYSYYLLASIYPKHTSKLWWKKYITQMQLFFLLVVHNVQMVLLPSCGYPKAFSIFLVIPQNLIMLAMFGDFYRKAYLKPQNKRQD